MSKDQLDQLKEVNDEIKDIKKTTDSLKFILNNTNLMDISSTIETFNLFTQQSRKFQGEMKKYINELSQRIDGLNDKIENIGSKFQSGVLNEKRITRNVSKVQNVNNVNSYKQQKTNNINKEEVQKSLSKKGPESRPSIVIAYPASPQETEIEGIKVDNTFDTVYSVAKIKKGNELGKMIDEIRLSLSKKNPLNPILFELSMEAGRLKSLGENKLNNNDFQILEQKINSWKKSK